MDASERITLEIAVAMLRLAEQNMRDGDLLRARERLASVIKALDRICYPESDT